MNTGLLRRRLSSRPRSHCQSPQPLRRSRAIGAAVTAVAILGAPASGVSTAQAPDAAPDDTSAPRPGQAAFPGVGALPIGSIVAFAPAASGLGGTTEELRAWLDARGWAICDGTRGTPDLRGRMLLGTTDASRVGERLGSQDHTHRVKGESGAPMLRNRHTRVGRAELKHLPDDQHRHRVDITSDRAGHLPPSTRVLFIMKLR